MTVRLAPTAKANENTLFLEIIFFMDFPLQIFPRRHFHRLTTWPVATKTVK